LPYERGETLAFCFSWFSELYSQKGRVQFLFVLEIKLTLACFRRFDRANSLALVFQYSKSILVPIQGRYSFEFIFVVSVFYVFSCLSVWIQGRLRIHMTSRLRTPRDRRPLLVEPHDRGGADGERAEESRRTACPDCFPLTDDRGRGGHTTVAT